MLSAVQSVGHIRVGRDAGPSITHCRRMPLAFTGIGKPNKIKHHCFGNWRILVEIPQIKKPFSCAQGASGSVLLRPLCHWAAISCLLLGFSQQFWDVDGRAWALLFALLPVSGPARHRACAPKWFVKWMNESSCIPSLKVGKWRIRFKRLKMRAWEGLISRQ